MTDQSSIYALAHSLRDHVNTPRVRTRLLRSGEHFWQALAALDLLGDTAEAVTAYQGRSAPDESSSAGDHYLRLYGLLTAFHLQQDAGLNLAKALSLKISCFDYPALRDVRDARTAVAGHPSRRDKGVAEPQFYFVYRYGLSDSGFEMGVASKGQGFRTEAVDIRYLNYQQATGMAEFLSDILSAAEQMEREHRRQFMSRSLAELLDGHGYQFEKVSSTGWGGSEPDTVMARPSIRELRKALEAFESELQARDLEVASFAGMQGIWPLLVGPLAKLDSYFSDPPNSHLDGLDAYALAELLESSWRDLLVMAREIDEEYAKPESTAVAAVPPPRADNQ